ncbi:LysR substrate-binding domain-containing protein [Klebsiella quasipneumoniae subsp. similipneumoniae]|uniref:LysR family transcriptional regulator n=1 Tax=Klebsiella quasipneumoniae TaxID=1463165 RepID=UPI000F08F1DC|nr:LysR family transcriptional regulator [Klebsiella quasipneumoniae]RND22716.1 LysR family transcriptional regulator [Klebsiella quasipneumoniae subsp. similipneumoniae]
MNNNTYYRSMFNNSYQGMVALATLFDEQGVSFAAFSLGISQPSMSKLLMDMRKEFNDPLYIKSNNTYTLTPVGEVLYSLVKNTIYTNQSTLDQLKKGVKKSYNIIMPHWFNLPEAPTLMQKIRMNYPEISLNFYPPYISGAKEILEKLKQGKIDVAVCHFINDIPAGFHANLLGFSELVFLCRKNNMTYMNDIDMKKLNTVPLIIYNVSPYLFNSFIEKNKINHNALNILMTVTNNFQQWIYQLTDENVILITLRTTAEELLNEGRYREIHMNDGTLSFAYNLMWHERSSKDPVHTLIRGSIINMNGNDKYCKLPKV